MSALARSDRVENLYPELFRLWARPAQFFNDHLPPADIRLDISENDKEYLVSAEVPGAKKEDIRVSVDGNYVSISADIKKEKEENHGHSLIRETYRGTVSRGFTLGSNVDDKASVAKLDDGVLRLTLPKQAGGSARALEIQ